MKSPTEKAEKGKTRDGGRVGKGGSKRVAEEVKSVKVGRETKRGKNFLRKSRDLARISSRGSQRDRSFRLPCFRCFVPEYKCEEKNIQERPQSTEEAETCEREASSDKVAKRTCKYMRDRKANRGKCSRLYVDGGS